MKRRQTSDDMFDMGPSINIQSVDWLTIHHLSLSLSHPLAHSGHHSNQVHCHHGNRSHLYRTVTVCVHPLFKVLLLSHSLTTDKHDRTCVSVVSVLLVYFIYLYSNHSLVTGRCFVFFCLLSGSCSVRFYKRNVKTRRSTMARLLLPFLRFPTPSMGY